MVSWTAHVKSLNIPFKGIPTIVIAACSADDVVAITGFGVFLGLSFNQVRHAEWKLRVHYARMDRLSQRHLFTSKTLVKFEDIVGESYSITYYIYFLFPVKKTFRRFCINFLYIFLFPL